MVSESTSDYATSADECRDREMGDQKLKGLLWYMCIYVYMHIHIYVHGGIYIHMYLFIYVYMYMYLIKFGFIAGNSSLEPLLEGLFAQIHVNLS